MICSISIAARTHENTSFPWESLRCREQPFKWYLISPRSFQTKDRMKPTRFLRERRDLFWNTSRAQKLWSSLFLPETRIEKKSAHREVCTCTPAAFARTNFAPTRQSFLGRTLAGFLPRPSWAPPPAAGRSRPSADACRPATIFQQVRAENTKVGTRDNGLRF